MNESNAPKVAAELVRHVAAAQDSGTAIVVLSNGMVVADVPIYGYDGLLVAERDTIRALLKEHNDDTEQVATALTVVAVERAGEYWHGSE